MSYHEHHHLVDPARDGKTSVWRLVSACVFILLFGYFLTGIVLEVALAIADNAGVIGFVDDVFSGATPQAMLLLLGSFGVWIFAIWIALHAVHERALRPVLGPQLCSHALKVFTLVGLVQLVVAVLPPWNGGMPNGMEYVVNLPFGRWLLLLPLSLIAVLIQVSAEEILFRGYLQQQLAAKWRSPLIWMVVPSALFGLGHYDSEAGSNAWLFVIWAMIFGLLMADLTARAGSLGPAIAVHFVTNVVAMVFVGVPDNLDGLALYAYPFGLEDEDTIRSLLPLDFAFLIVSWLAARLALRR
ncbi:MAG: type II CAAX endopeptidase family protein [Aliishimia sp.]